MDAPRKRCRLGRAAERHFGRARNARFGPAGADPTIRIVREYREAETSPDFVIDDFELQPGLATSSSGGGVTHDANNLLEILMRDEDTKLAWTGAQPQNGMTRGRFVDAYCLIFDWSPGDTPFIPEDH